MCGGGAGARGAGHSLHLGDLSPGGAGNAGDLRYGRRQLDRLPVAWRAVPGNHAGPARSRGARRVGARAADLVRATAAWAFDHETELRTMLRLPLTPERENEQPRRA
jgi:hypothetical protein